jgi:hypothetical protein
MKLSRELNERAENDPNNNTVFAFHHIPNLSRSFTLPFQ